MYLPIMLLQDVIGFIPPVYFYDSYTGLEKRNSIKTRVTNIFLFRLSIAGSSTWQKTLKKAMIKKIVTGKNTLSIKYRT
jgi:hypothetical protein